MTDAELTHCWQSLQELKHAALDISSAGVMGQPTSTETHDRVVHAIAHLEKILALSWASDTRMALVVLQPCALQGLEAPLKPS